MDDAKYIYYERIKDNSSVKIIYIFPTKIILCKCLFGY